jgi:hypothetical protein
MPGRIRESMSNSLLRVGAERTLDRQRLESSMARADPRSPGYSAAFAAISAARVYESALLWLGWRLQPRTFVPR